MNAKKIFRAPAFWALLLIAVFVLMFATRNSNEYARVDTSVAEKLVTDGKVEDAHFTTDNLLQLDLKEGQTYSDGEAVAWAEVAAEGAAEPAHPAPSLTVAAGVASDGHGHGADTGASSEWSDDGSGSDTTARVLGIAGLAVGAIGVGVGVTGRRRGAAAGASGAAAS